MKEVETEGYRWVLGKDHLMIDRRDGAMFHIPKAEFAEFLNKAGIVHAAVVLNSRQGIAPEDAPSTMGRRDGNNRKYIP